MQKRRTKSQGKLDKTQASVDRAKEIDCGAVHQISQPMSAIAGNIRAASVCVSHCNTQNCGVKPILLEVEAELKQTREIISQLQALAHPKRQWRQMLNLNRLVENLVRQIDASAAKRRFQIELELAANLPKLPLDDIQINQMLLNLLNNAFDALAGCRRANPKVIIRTRARENHVELDVTDASRGIAPKNLSRLFDLFFTTKARGIGVGLNFCQMIASAHGGSIEAFNNPNQSGATFRLKLPVQTRKL